MQMLDPPHKIIKHKGKQNPSKKCHYHNGIGHNISKCMDLLRQLWKLYKDKMMDEFVK